MRPLLREHRPWVHYKSQPDAKAQRETQKSKNVKSSDVTVKVRGIMQPVLKKKRKGCGGKDLQKRKVLSLE